MARASRWLGAASLCVLLIAQSAPGDASAYGSEATLIIKIGKFVHWPPNTFTHPGGILRLCILGSDDSGDGIEALAGQKLQEKTIVVARLASSDASVTECHIVFIRKSERGRLTAVLGSTARSPVLTVSDIDGFASDGGMVGFRSADGRTQFEINVAATKRAGLTIGAQLLQIAALNSDERSDAGP
jgi:hypothetical protein